MHQAVINILLCDTFPGLLPESIPSHEYFFEKRFHSVNTNIIFKVFRTLDGELPEHPVADELHLILNHSENEDDAVKQRALASLEKMEHQGKTVAKFLLKDCRGEFPRRGE